MKPASPLPWTNGEGGKRPDGHVFSGDRMVAGCMGYANNFDPAVNEANAQNARYIVHACNLYPDLLAALKNLIEASMLPVECVHGEAPDYCDGCRYGMEKAAQMARIHARALIAKAETPEPDR